MPMKICMKMVSLKEYWIIVDLLHSTKKRQSRLLKGGRNPWENIPFSPI